MYYSSLGRRHMEVLTDPRWQTLHEPLIMSDDINNQLQSSGFALWKLERIPFSDHVIPAIKYTTKRHYLAAWAL